MSKIKVTLNNEAGELDSFTLEFNDQSFEDAPDDHSPREEVVSGFLQGKLFKEWTRLFDGDTITIEEVEE